MKKIKISIKLFIITAILLLCMQVSAMATTGKSNATGVRIRKSPSTDSEVLNTLGTDDVVEILGKEGDWYKVTFKGLTGYVSQSFISTSEGNNNQTPNETNVQSGNTKPEANTQENNQGDNKENTDNQTGNKSSSNKIFKIAETAKVTILPVITSEQIGEIKKDENVTLIINAGLWAYINSESINGWIRIDKLSTEGINTDNYTGDNNDMNNDKNNDNNNNDNNDSDNNNDDNNNNSNNNNNNNNDNNDSNNNNKDNNAGNATDGNKNNTYTAKTMYANSTATNVRSQSNTTSDVVESIGLNAEVKVVGEENDWYKVEVNGKSGYIRKDLLSNEKTEVTSRANTIDRTAQQSTDTAVDNVTQTNQQAENIATTHVTTEVAPVSSSGVTGNDIVAYAKNYLGCKYVYGAAGPNSFDCSGFTMYVYSHFGYSLSHSSKVQATQGVAVTGDLQAGDILVFSNDGKTVGHVGIYIGNDKFIHASDGTTGVIISNLSDRWNISKYWGARRIL